MLLMFPVNVFCAWFHHLNVRCIIPKEVTFKKSSFLKRVFYIFKRVLTLGQYFVNNYIIIMNLTSEIKNSDIAFFWCIWGSVMLQSTCKRELKGSWYINSWNSNRVWNYFLPFRPSVIGRSSGPLPSEP